MEGMQPHDGPDAASYLERLLAAHHAEDAFEHEGEDEPAVDDEAC